MSARYEDDPRWQEAHARWIAERGHDESAVQRYLRGVTALHDMFAIEIEYAEQVAA